MTPVTTRYSLIEEVGRGGMSVIWRGHDDVLDRSVAIKVLAPGFADNEEFRDRIRREARAAARLSHPYVGTVYDFGEAPSGRPYLVMELIDGVTLAELLRDAPLPCPRALAVCAQVAAALAAAHAHGLVHRDVKPGNVMVTASGAKLVDFGISAMIDEEQPKELPHMLLGTPAYVAPEVVTGSPAGTPADVYALGVLQYRTLTGQLPWPADTPTQVLRAHVLQEPRPLPRVDGVPAALVDLTRRCLAKDPADRPTAAEVAAAWSAAARAATARTARPVRTLSFPTIALPRRFSPRRLADHRRLVTGLSALLGLIAFPSDQHQHGAAATVLTGALAPGGTDSFPFTGGYRGIDTMPAAAFPSASPHRGKAGDEAKPAKEPRPHETNQ